MPPTPLRPTALRIEPLGLDLPVQPAQSLLEAALAAGVQLPRLCRNGSCRECIAQLLEGQVRHRIEWPGLSADEKAQGWILPCIAEPEGDVVLLQPRTAPPQP